MKELIGICTAGSWSVRVLLTVIIATGCAGCLFAGQPPPLTVEDISLMLRSGCSSEMIVREVTARHFAGPLESVSESQLQRQNASQALLDALKSSSNAASEGELAQARKRIDDAKAAAQQAAEHQATDQNQLASYEKKPDADRQYLAQLADAGRLNERVKIVLSLWSTSTGFSNTFSTDPQTNSDQRRALLRAQQAATQEIPRSYLRGMDTQGWRRANRINELMQDESFVRESLK